MTKSNKFSPEVREGAVRMVQEHRGDYPSLWAAVESIAPKIGCVAHTLHEWVKKAEVDSGQLCRKHHLRCPAHQGARTREQRAAPSQRHPQDSQRVFCPGGARLPAQVVKTYIDCHRDDFGVEPICRVLQMAPSCYWRHAARQRDPQLRSVRARRDESLMADIQRIWHANWQVYGADKVWLQMNREGIQVARCTVERLMRAMGLQGARRGKTVRTTTPDTSVPCPLDYVKRQFKATGTLVNSTDRDTRAVFREYVHIYDIKQAVPAACQIYLQANLPGHFLVCQPLGVIQLSSQSMAADI